jgi:hypothetical protein
MSDFLSRLAERALGVAALVRPRIEPIFAPKPREENFLEPEPSLPALASSASPEAPCSPVLAPQKAESPVSVEAVAEQRRPVRKKGFDAGEPLLAASEEEAPARIERHTPPLWRTNSTGLESFPAPRMEPDRASAPVVEPRQTRRASEEALAAPVFVSPSQSMAAPVQLMRPQAPARATLPAPGEARSPAAVTATAATPAVFRRRTDSHATAPTRGEPEVVRVTIGRIDVRAELPPPTARLAPRRAEPPGLSLDEYLKQRAEGRR